MSTDAQETARSVLRYGLFALVLVAPLPFGSVQPGAVVAIEISALLLAAGALWVHLGAGRPLPDGVRRCLWPALGLLAIGALQLLPWPHGLLSRIAGPTAAAREAVAPFVPGSASTYSLSPPDTVDALLRLAAYVMIGLATVVAVRTPRHARQAVVVILLAATFQGLYGSFEYLSGRQHIFGYAKQHYLDEATGTFVNRNHFAGYLAVAVPFALGLLMAPALAARKGRSLRQRLLDLDRGTTWLRILAAVAVASAWIGILLSYSRAALGAAMVASAVLFWLVAASRRRIALVLVPAVAATAMLLWVEVRVPLERFMELDRVIASESGRLPVWKASTGLLASYPVLGTGLGTFEAAFETVKPAAATARWDHAHNDWLQSAVAGGLLAPVMLLLLVVGVVRGPRPERGSAARAAFVPAACIAAVTAMALHGLVDFSMRIPAYAVLAAFVVGLRFVDVPEPAVERLDSPRRRRRRRRRENT